ncbi:ThiF family adenylyltransferase [Pontibacter toksunensis]|uniref:ThiF family adenylyltransferase n=2 Tax=Pontibacter toksunensis TaxID=1332631 RepID=A0ABW6BZW5_9BACT
MNELDQLALSQSSVLMSEMRGVELLGDWEPIPSSNACILRVRLELLNTAPTKDIPLFTEWGVIVDFNIDPWGKVQVHPSNGPGGVTTTFEHQQYNGGPHPLWPVRNGHICSLSETHGLAASRNAMETEPPSTVHRVVWHMARAVEWLQCAATDTLTVAGDSFELPDFDTAFRYKIADSKNRIFTLAYYEDGDSFSHWKQSHFYIGTAAVSYLNQVAIVREFKDHRGDKTVHKPSWGTAINQLQSHQDALWVRLDEVPAINRWQVPTTMKELAEAVASQGKSLIDLLRPALAKFETHNELLLFVGMPIPRKVKEAPYRYHWQALVLSPKTNVSAKARVSLVENALRSASSVRWVSRAENWHPDDLQNRGRVSPPLRKANVLLLGAGALGANLAEQLVRMGVTDMTLVDPDLLEAGNLVRHPLNLPQLNRNKAVSVADGLNHANPSARVVGLAVSATSKDKALEDAVRAATLIIDATASDTVLRELPFLGITGYVPVISISLGLHAQRLFFYADSASCFDADAFYKWFNPYRVEEHLAVLKEDMPRGIGCWHPLTPARLNRIVGLAGVAVELIEQVCEGQISLPVGCCHSWHAPKLETAERESVA